MLIEKNKKQGMYYAFTEDGIELPIIDITHPACDESANAEELTALAEDFVDFQELPSFIRGFISQRSIALRGLDSASGKFLGGMTTYVAKLKPELLGKAYSGMIDRKIASGIGSVAFRLRLKDTAQFLANELAPMLEKGPNTNLYFINIGGGPAMDSLNALILLNKKCPELLANRRMWIQVFDIDQLGPKFGSRALAALLSQGAPLDGLNVTFEHIPYDWANVDQLQKSIQEIDKKAIMIGSSEGGLFEYGSEEIIINNLQAVKSYCSKDFTMIGSIFSDGNIPQFLKEVNKIPIQAYKLEEFNELAKKAGWQVDCATESSPTYQVVSLKPI
jgi:hypothetical protein